MRFLWSESGEPLKRTDCSVSTYLVGSYRTTSRKYLPLRLKLAANRFRRRQFKLGCCERAANLAGKRSWNARSNGTL